MLDDGTRVCAAPVPPNLWGRFVARTNDPHVPNTVAADLWTKDIKKFLAWLKGWTWEPW